jgi:hypothetical protein
MVISQFSMIDYAIPDIRYPITVTFGALLPPSFSTLNHLVPVILRHY